MADSISERAEARLLAAEDEGSCRRVLGSEWWGRLFWWDSDVTSRCCIVSADAVAGSGDTVVVGADGAAGVDGASAGCWCRLNMMDPSG